MNPEGNISRINTSKNIFIEASLLFFLICGAVILRVHVESTNYCTPDSKYYMETAANIISGNGFVAPKVFDFNFEESRLIPLYDQTPFGQPEAYKKEFMAVWPLGYSTLIAAISYVTCLSPLWASKILNLLFLALDFYLLILIFGKKNILTLYYFLSFTMLEVISYTWSENMYITFFLLLILSFKKLNEKPEGFINVLLIFGALLGMCLARYASIIYFFLTALAMIWYFFKNEKIKAKIIFLSLLVSSIVFGLYLYNNYFQSGYLTGMPRMNTQEFTSNELMRAFFMGIFHQIHIIKQFRFSGIEDFILYITTVLLQLSLTIVIFYKITKIKIQFNFKESINLLLIASSILYLIFQIYITSVSTIDPFDYRTLLPFSLPLFLVGINFIENNLHKEVKYLKIIKIFFLISLVLNLPKRYLIELIF